MNHDTEKVFGIGFHKTGTSSLKDALTILGYRVAGAKNVRDPDIGETYRGVAEKWSHRYDAFQDNPWPLVYREMDRLWPKAKFILTVRNSEKWIASQVRHFGTGTTPMREVIYGKGRGCPVGNESHYVAVLEAHNAAVQDYFAARPDKLLVMNISKGDGWELICPFLGHPLPDKPFPHSNSGIVREARQRRRMRLRTPPL